MSQLKKLSGAAAFMLFLAAGLWQTCFQVTNEIGPVGMDTAGRQIFLQSLDHYIDQQIDTLEAGYALEFTSGFHDRPIILRFFQEPMRTVFRMRYRIYDDNAEIDPQFHERFLNSPASVIVGLFGDSIYVTENRQGSTTQLEQRLRDLNVETTAELLSAFGFRRFDVFMDGDRVASDSLPAIASGNVQHIGG